MGLFLKIHLNKNIFWIFFYINYKKYWLGLVVCKIIFNRAKIFVLKLLEMVIHKSALGLNEDQSSNLWDWNIVKHEGFTEECVIYMVKNVLV